MKRICIATAVAMALAGCSRDEPIPGSSVASDGAVTLSPPRFSMPAAEPPPGPIEGQLFPPELIMEHQQALGIDAAQREGITKEMEKSQGELMRLQWDIQAEREKLVAILEPEKVDEAKARDEAVRLMDIETKIKSTHLGMLIRIKNLLRSDQQKKLRDLRMPHKDSG